MQNAGIREAGKDARLGAAGQYLQIEGGKRSFYFGIEGVSPRVRRAFGKALSDEQIVEMMERLDGPGGNIKWYLIPGAPGEADSDRAAFMDLLHKVGRRYRERSLTITPTLFQAIPHTPLQWADNRHRDEAAEWCADLKGLLKDWNAREGRVRWLLYTPKHRNWHQFDAYIRRLGREGAALLVSLRGREGRVYSGRWRQDVENLGLPDIDHTLRELDPREPTPWSHVDVGMKPKPVRAAWDHYWRIMGERQVAA